MKVKIFLKLIVFLIASGPVVLAQQFSLKKDLQTEWMVYEEKGYVPFAGREDAAQTIYFWLDAETYSADRLLLESPRHFDVFVNGQVAGGGTRLVLAVDSLAKVFGTSNLLVGVRQDKIRAGGLTTIVEEPIQFSSALNEIELRKSTAFKDFVITGVIILLLMLVVIIRLNPKLATDYFSVTKIFSMREGDDNQLYFAHWQQRQYIVLRVLQYAAGVLPGGYIPLYFGAVYAGVVVPGGELQYGAVVMA